mmetsp:Transcript_37937/g.87616  ORF Transcript_37937/g.87616 Transcript_37937/m.87616 type:complete len:85 (-) Transcript_37937:883-1137(-)
MADEEIDLDGEEPTYHAVPPPRDESAAARAEPEPVESEPRQPERKKSAAELRLEAIRKKLVRAASRPLALVSTQGQALSQKPVP